ncbi:MAG TPA: hypothetical protein VFX64_04565 [Candidatus Nitrosotalea sp.]|nr:hypothetical protein [Candidatus Nitrosotalea sp.]
MAEGFYRKYAPKGWISVSAGSRPTLEINPIAVESMKEVGIDVSKQKPKELSDELIRSSFLKVSMGCIDKTKCDAVFLGNHRGAKKNLCSKHIFKLQGTCIKSNEGCNIFTLYNRRDISKWYCS